MAERDRNNFAQNQSADDLDRVLDAALARYASVEPRSGLEQRVMANLSTAARHTQTLGWWRWGAAAVLAIVLVVAGLAWKSSRTSHPAIANHAPGTGVSKDASQGSSANINGAVPAVSHPGVKRVIRRQKRFPESANTLTASAPKRQQFPSPQPLSEQEQLLASYVERFPEHAVLIARAQAELEQRDHEEEMREMNGTANQDPKQIQE
jgi:hypothetical protein